MSRHAKFCHGRARRTPHKPNIFALAPCGDRPSRRRCAGPRRGSGLIASPNDATQRYVGNILTRFSGSRGPARKRPVEETNACYHLWNTSGQALAKWEKLLRQDRRDALCSYAAGVARRRERWSHP